MSQAKLPPAYAPEAFPPVFTPSKLGDLLKATECQPVDRGKIYRKLYKDGKIPYTQLQLGGYADIHC